MIAVSACGSLKEALAPGHVVIPDQLFDYTKDERARSFFGEGIVAHVGVADPFCPVLSGQLAQACSSAGATVHEGGTFITIEGPRFSTKAESLIWRNLGIDIIGMTTSPEAFLAREAEMHYAVMAHVTDYDVWHEEQVSADAVFKQFSANVALAQHAVIEAVKHIAATADEDYNCGCDSALKSAFATNPDHVSNYIRQRLKPIIGKYFP